jgi:hypothetical protein
MQPHFPSTISICLLQLPVTQYLHCSLREQVLAQVRVLVVAHSTIRSDMFDAPLLADASDSGADTNQDRDRETTLTKMTAIETPTSLPTRRPRRRSLR